MIEVEGLTKRYKETVAVDDLSFEMRARARSPGSSVRTDPASRRPCA